MNRDVMNYILIGVSLIALVVLYVLFAFLPLHKRMQEHKADYVAQQKKLLAAQELVARYDEFMNRMSRMQIELIELESRVPVKPGIPDLLKDVTRIAAECDIRNFQFAPQTLDRKENYAIQPIQVTVTCNYHALGMFVTKLAALPRLINTQDVQILGRDKTGAIDSISAKMTLVTYVQQHQ